MRRILPLALLLSASSLSMAGPALHAASKTSAFAAATFSGTWSSMGMAAVVTKAEPAAAANNSHLAIHLPEFLRKGGKADYSLHRVAGNRWTTTDNGLVVTFSLTSENVAKLNLAGNGPDQTLDLPLFRN